MSTNLATHDTFETREVASFGCDAMWQLKDAWGDSYPEPLRGGGMHAVAFEALMDRLVHNLTATDLKLILNDVLNTVDPYWRVKVTN